MAWLWWAPSIAASLHIVEEFVIPGGFGEWDRAYRPRLRASITPRLHVAVNAALLVLCAMVGLAGSAGGVAIGSLRLRSAIPPSEGGAAWVALAALLLSNAAFHVVGAIRTRRYSPGIVTAVALYVPLAFVGAGYLLRAGRVSALDAAVGAAIGGSYPLWAHLLHVVRARR